MFNLLRFLNPSSIAFKALEYLAIASIMYWAYDYVHVKPVRDVKVAYEKKITELNDEVTLKNGALKIVGDRINICLKDLQSFKDAQSKNELEAVYRTIDDMKFIGDEDENDSTFNLYNYSF